MSPAKLSAKEQDTKTARKRLSVAMLAAAAGVAPRTPALVDLDPAVRRQAAAAVVKQLGKSASGRAFLARHRYMLPGIDGSGKTQPRGGWLRTPDKAIGCGVHRSGWPHVVAALNAAGKPPILVDDFIEQSFVYDIPHRVHRQPWIGIFHHPPGMPPFSPPAQRPQAIFERHEFKASLPNLRGAIALSEYLACWLRSRLPCPVVTIKHPTDRPAVAWSVEQFAANPSPMLLQTGFYLRNICAAEQVPTCKLQPARLTPADRPWMDHWECQVRELWDKLGTRTTYGPVVDVPAATPAEYDRLLAENVVLTEVFDSSANNVVVECIARGTPLVVNRHPAVVEYVGEDYPLLFDRIEDVPKLVDDRERIVAAHKRFMGMNRGWLDAGKFAADVLAFVGQVARGTGRTRR